jgi:hypothetical protein
MEASKKPRCRCDMDSGECIILSNEYVKKVVRNLLNSVDMENVSMKETVDVVMKILNLESSDKKIVRKIVDEVLLELMDQ